MQGIQGADHSSTGDRPVALVLKGRIIRMASTKFSKEFSTTSTSKLRVAARR